MSKYDGFYVLLYEQEANAKQFIGPMTKKELEVYVARRVQGVIKVVRVTEAYDISITQTTQSTWNDINPIQKLK